jgi:hypothetical protein
VSTLQAWSIGVLCGSVYATLVGLFIFFGDDEF